MLIGSWGLLESDPSAFVRLAVLIGIALVSAITVHEFSHALVAQGLGDGTARRLGRLSLNPIRHLDPAGTAMIFIAGFGWGKPVPVDERQLSRGDLGMAMVAFAGPLSNLVFAFLLAVPVKAGLLVPLGPSLDGVTRVMSGGFRDGMSDIVGLVIFFNLLLGVFNLIPLAPLDGSKVLGGFVPRDRQAEYARFQQRGPVILVAVVMLDFMLGLGILWGAIGPIVRGLTSLATGY